MNQNPEILFITEYIEKKLYFATVRQGKALKSSYDVEYICIDNELVYENYYSDFGPLNLGCVYRYCKLLSGKLIQKNLTVVHYTSVDYKKKANSAFLIACYGVLYLGLNPRAAIKPLMAQGQSYRAFQDATQGSSIYKITLLDCVQAILKARVLGFFDFKDFCFSEYERLDKIQGGDLNWIIPGRFLAFIGPVDYSVSLHHSPEIYIDFFHDNNVKLVIRLNKRMYDSNTFIRAGITHVDLFFPDGSCPPRHVLIKFLEICENCNGAIAVHCKAGLGRTGTLIGSYLIKHYRMSAHEAIGWLRICRPGSVIGHQQDWLEQIESWLLKQGTLYRKRLCNDINKLPVHNFGICSYACTNKLTNKNMEHNYGQKTLQNRIDSYENSVKNEVSYKGMMSETPLGQQKLLKPSVAGKKVSCVESKLLKGKSVSGDTLKKPVKLNFHLRAPRPANKMLVQGMAYDILQCAKMRGQGHSTSSKPILASNVGLGRSPSPSPKPSPTSMNSNRATDTNNVPVCEKSSLKSALEKLRTVHAPRKTSVGASSLDARRISPDDTRAASVKSADEPSTTQGDRLNSIKFQRQYLESLRREKTNPASKDIHNNSNSSMVKRAKATTSKCLSALNSDCSNLSRPYTQLLSPPPLRTKPLPFKTEQSSSRPMSPKARAARKNHD